jgi:hypothetical protein
MIGVWEGGFSFILAVFVKSLVLFSCKAPHLWAGLPLDSTNLSEVSSGSDSLALV